MKISKSQIDSIIYEIHKKYEKELSAEKTAFHKSKEVEAIAKKVLASINKLPSWYTESLWTESKTIDSIKRKYTEKAFKSKVRKVKSVGALFHHINLLSVDCLSIDELMKKINPYV